MKRALIFFVLHCVFLPIFAGEILIQEAFNTPESVEKYPSGVKVSFDKGEKGEGGALKMEASENVHFGGLSLPVDARKLRGSVLELSGEMKGEKIAPGPKYYNGAKFLLVINSPSGNIYGGSQMPTGNFGWKKVKLFIRVPYDATGGRLNLGFEESRGSIWIKNIKLEKTITPVDLRASANVGFACGSKDGGDSGWFGAEPGEDASKFNYKQSSLFGNVPYSIIYPDSNKGKSALLLKPADSKKAGAVSAKIRFAAPQNAKYLYVLNALETSASGQVGEITIFGENGKSHAFKLQGGVDVAPWQNVKKDLKNAAIGAAWLADKGWRRSNGLYSTRLEIPKDFGKIESIEFGKASVGWMVVAASLSDEKFPFPSENRFVTSESKQWRAMPHLEDYAVKEGSALDCSDLWPVKEVKSRVVASKDGHLELEDNPGVPVAFQTVADQGTTYNIHTATKESTEKYVKQLRVQGYNMVRFHYFDFALMGGAKEPLQFNEDLLKRIDYYIYCLKKNGIYLNLDAMCSRYGFELGNTWAPDNSDRDYNYDLFFKPAARKNWYEGVKKLLTHVNPYTNTKLADDPVLAIVNGKNEQEFGMLREPKNPERMKPYWIEFLKNRYGGDIAKYNAAWGESVADWEKIKVFNRALALGTDARARDIAAFKLERENEMWKWFEKSLREIGYKGLCVNFDMVKSLRYASVRKNMPIVTMHSYHAHPSPTVGGVSRISQSSSLSDANSVFRGVAGTALWKKPLLITEYGHVFWNKYRYEQAFSMAAYAALQGHCALTVHAQSVTFNESVIYPFGRGPDPINKACEFLATHMLLRRDVSEAKPSVRIDFSTRDALEKMNINGGLTGGQSKLSLIAKLSLLPDSDAPVGKDEIAIKSTKGAAIITYPGYSVVADYKDNFDTDSIVEQFKKRGLIPESNRTNAKDGIFESATGELFLDSYKNYMTVDTPRLQGLCAEAKSKCELSDFAVTRMGARGCVAIVSVDGLPLSESKRAVLVYATNALNSGMVFEDDTMRGLISNGKIPILYQTAKLSFRLKNKNADNFKLYALGMDGERVQELNTRVDGEILRASIDTSKIKIPAVFFELVCE